MIVDKPKIQTAESLFWKIDEKYWSIFEHGHIWFFMVEYVVFPAVIFKLILDIVHKEARSSSYKDIHPWIEIIARNRKEMMITFSLTYLLFEVRVAGDYSYKYTYNSLFTFQTDALINPFALSLILVSLLTIFFLIYYYNINNRLESLDDFEFPEVIPTIRWAVLPSVIFLYLVISVCAYSYPGIRIILTITSTIFSAFYFLKMPYTSIYWWNKGKKIPATIDKNMSTRDKELQIEAVGFFLKSYLRLDIKRDITRKVEVICDAERMCLAVYHNSGLSRGDKEFNAKLSKVESLMKTANVYATKNKTAPIHLTVRLGEAMTRLKEIK